MARPNATRASSQLLAAIRSRLRPAGTAVLLLLVALLLALLGVGWLCVALYLALAAELGAPVSALLTAALLLLLAALAAALARLRAASARRPARAEGEPADLAALSEDLGRRGGAYLREHKGAALGLGFAAGLAIGISPRLRRALLRLLE